MKKFLILLLLSQSFLIAQSIRSVSLGPEMVIPVGGFSRSSGAGYGGTVKFDAVFSNSWGILIQGGYYHFPGKVLNIQGDVNSTYTKYFRNGEFAAGVVHYAKTGIKIFAAVSIDFYAIKTEGRTLINNWNQETNRTDSFEKYGIFAGAGYNYLIDEVFSIEFAARIHYLDDNTSYIGINSGLRITF